MGLDLKLGPFLFGLGSDFKLGPFIIWAGFGQLKKAQSPAQPSLNKPKWMRMFETGWAQASSYDHCRTWARYGPLVQDLGRTWITFSSAWYCP